MSEHPPLLPVLGGGPQRADLLADRFRLGLWIVLATFLLLTIFDLLDAARIDRVLLLHAVQCAVVVAGLRWMRDVGESQVELRAILLMIAIFVGVGLEAIAEVDVMTAPSLAILFVLGAAILLPWSVRAQLVVALFAGALIMVVVLAMRDRVTPRMSTDPLAASVVAIVCSVLVVHQIDRQRRAAADAALGRSAVEEELRNSSDQLRALSERLRSVREEESTRIAREIHDELGQCLTGLKLELGWIQRHLPRPLPPDPPVEAKLRSLSAQVDEIIETVRRIATELRPGVLDSLGLVPAVEWQAREFSRRTGIPVEVSIAPPDVKIDRARSTALFRILQEILTNVARHAQASVVQLELRADDHGVSLRVTDDGKGVPPAAFHAVESLGILGMKERARAVGGTFTIRNRAGGGTLAIVEVPSAALRPGGTETQPHT